MRCVILKNVHAHTHCWFSQGTSGWKSNNFSMASYTITRFFSLSFLEFNILKSFPPSGQFLRKLTIRICQSAHLILIYFEFFFKLLNFFLKRVVYLFEFFIQTKIIFVSFLQLLPILRSRFLKQLISSLQILECFLALFQVGFYLVQLGNFWRKLFFFQV